MENKVEIRNSTAEFLTFVIEGQDSVCAKFAHTAEDGKTYQTFLYSLDAIISVGYRVNSVRATQFRQPPPFRH